MPSTIIADMIAQRRAAIVDAERRRIAELEERNAHYLEIFEAIKDLANQLSLPTPVLSTNSTNEITSISFQELQICLDMDECGTIIWHEAVERPFIIASLEPLTIINSLLNCVPPSVILTAGEHTCPAQP